MRELLTHVRKSKFIRNTMVVMSGTVLAQAISFALMPLLSRAYSPADFGVFGAFYALFAVFAAATTLDYAQAVVLPKRDQDAISLFVVSCVSTFFIAILS